MTSKMLMNFVAMALSKPSCYLEQLFGLQRVRGFIFVYLGLKMIQGYSFLSPGFKHLFAAPPPLT